MFIADYIIRIYSYITGLHRLIYITINDIKSKAALKLKYQAII